MEFNDVTDHLMTSLSKGYGKGQSRLRARTSAVEKKSRNLEALVTVQVSSKLILVQVTQAVRLQYLSELAFDQFYAMHSCIKMTFSFSIVNGSPDPNINRNNHFRAEKGIIS